MNGFALSRMLNDTRRQLADLAASLDQLDAALTQMAADGAVRAAVERAAVGRRERPSDG